MNAPTHTADELLDLEWERIALVCRCVGELRQDKVPAEQALSRLREIETTVKKTRKENALWRRLSVRPLGDLEHEVLVFAVAPEIVPQIGFLLQQLQPGPPQPYPTAALLQELLGLSPHAAAAMLAVLSEQAPLRMCGLLDPEDTGPYAPIRPARGVAARLMGIPQPPVAPPGAVPIPLQARWSDLVLAPERVALLQEMLFWVRHRRTVVEEWGGRPVGGPVALFTGPPGTGNL